MKKYKKPKIDGKRSGNKSSLYDRKRWSVFSLQAEDRIFKLLRGSRKEIVAVDLSSLEGFVDTLRDCLRELNQAAQIDESLARLVGEGVMQSAYPVMLLLRNGDTKGASELLVSIWKTTLDALEGRSESLDIKKDEKPGILTSELEFLAAWNMAVTGVQRLNESQAEARDVLRQLAGILDLSLDELGRMFSVSGETVRRWQRGTHPIPSRRIAELISAHRSVSRLLQMFRSHRLAQVIRRKVDLFDGERALDWLLRGRHADVADSYENALMYQA